MHTRVVIEHDDGYKPLTNEEIEKQERELKALMAWGRKQRRAAERELERRDEERRKTWESSHSASEPYIGGSVPSKYDACRYEEDMSRYYSELYGYGGDEGDYLACEG